MIWPEVSFKEYNLMVIYRISWKWREKEGKENKVETTTIGYGEGKQGLRFRKMDLQNSGEESRLKRAYKNRTNGWLNVGYKQEEGKMTVNILAWVTEKIPRRPSGIEEDWRRGERLHLEINIWGLIILNACWNLKSGWNCHGVERKKRVKDGI